MSTLIIKKNLVRINIKSSLKSSVKHNILAQYPCNASLGIENGESCRACSGALMENHPGTS